MPLFTVITATWNRSRLILPTVQSVLAQTMGDFEYLIAGDRCTDDTGAVVTALGDPRLRFLNAQKRAFSQAGPNNLALGEARGRFIAYLGHDDIWHPEHLAGLARVLTRRNGPDFAVAGCINFSAPRADRDEVTTNGPPQILSGPAFFVPSAIGHRREVIDRIGPWSMPDDCDRNVDVEFEARAFQAGLRFASTGSVTVFKFTAGKRYLSYLDPSADEQEDVLLRLAGPGFDRWLEDKVAHLAASGRAQLSQPVFGDGLARGEGGRMARRMKGVGLTEPRRLRLFARVPHQRGWHALDWHGAGPRGGRFLTSGPSAEPAFLLPLRSGAGAGAAVSIFLPVRHPRPGAIRTLAFKVNGKECPGVFHPGQGGDGFWELSAMLRPDGPSLLRIIQPEAAMLGPERRGIELGTVTVVAPILARLVLPAARFNAAFRDLLTDLGIAAGVVGPRKNP